jgi:hypothetical protein
LTGGSGDEVAGGLFVGPYSDETLGVARQLGSSPARHRPPRSFAYKSSMTAALGPDLSTQ